MGSLSPKFKINYQKIYITKVKQQSTIVFISVIWKLRDSNKPTANVRCQEKKTSFLLTPVTSSQVPKWLTTKTFHQNQNLSGVYIHMEYI